MRTRLICDTRGVIIRVEAIIDATAGDLSTRTNRSQTIIDASSMASLAGASVTSQDLADIEALQAQLLNVSTCACGTTAGGFDAKLTQASLQHKPSDSNAIHNHALLAQDTSGGSEVPESQDIHPTVPPHIAIQSARSRDARSAPPPTTDMMEGVSISQRRLLATTFHGDIGGDTQVNDTQVYRPFRNQIESDAITTPDKPPHAAEDTTGSKSLDENTFTNLGGNVGDGNGDGSFLELNLSPGGRSDISDMNSILASPRIELQHVARRAGGFPETPQLAGRERGSDGEIVTSTAQGGETPGFDGLFGPAKTPLLTTTQLFQRTQAVSSPLPDGPRSDAVLTRPSPNLQENSILTSHPGFSSSPNFARHHLPSSTAFEPREKYTSMLESQTRRTQFISTGLHGLPEEDDPFDNSDARRLDNRKLRRILSDQGLAECRSVSAPARPSSSAVVGRQSSTRADLTHQHIDGSVSSPQKPLAQVIMDTREPIEISDEEESNPDTSEHEADQQGGSNDAYDEFAQAVVRSSASGHADGDDVDMFQNEPAHFEESIVSHGVAEIVPGSQVLQDTSRVFHATQHTSIVGSQTVPQSEKRSLLSAQQQQSSTTSVIPGSQYPQITSQQMARQSQAWSRSQVSTTIHPPLTEQARRVASSPPLPEPLDGEDEVVEDTNITDTPQSQKLAGGVQHDNLSLVGRAEQLARNQSLPPASDEGRSSKGSQAYATAQTQPSPLRPRSSHLDSQHSMATPLKRAGARRAADIANMLTQRTGDDDPLADIDDAAEVLNELEHSQAMSPSRRSKRNSSPVVESRPQKRRRNQRTVKSSKLSPSMVLQEQDGVANQINNSRTTPGVFGEPIDSAHAHRSALSMASEEHAQQDYQTTTADQDLDLQALQDDAQDESIIDTPDSVKKREAAGSAVVSQLVATRTTRGEQHAKLSGPGKRTYSRKGRAKQEGVQQPAQPHLIETIEDHALQEKSETEPAISHPEDNVHGAAERSISSPVVVRPDRVFALFKDARLMYYPATVTSQPVDAGLVHVKFDDGSESVVRLAQVAPLDLRIGDTFKVDANNMRNNWIVQAYGPNGQGSPDDKVDIYGHSTMLVHPKGTKRASLPAGQAESGKAIEISVTNIYLPQSMLSVYKARESTLPPIEPHLDVRPTTPVRASTSTNVSTPKSRSGRQAARKQQYILPSSSVPTDELTRAPKARKSGDLFGNMAFAVTTASNTSENEAARQDWIDEIRANGGIVLDDFDELFDALNVVQRRVHTGAQRNDKLALKTRPQFEGLGFVALISDKHCRKTKYIQALALGLPTLSSRWLIDSLDQARSATAGNNGPLHWSKYLLPAGDSAYLNGAVHSRTLIPYLPSHASFQDTISNRQLLLNGDKVLAVMPRKDRSSLAGKRQSYAFLTFAIGAGDIRPVEDIEEALNVLLDDESWTYIMVDSNVQEAAEAVDGNHTRGSKKRRSIADSDGMLSSRSKDGRHVIISHEYVMQSLILGALVE